MRRARAFFIVASILLAWLTLPETAAAQPPPSDVTATQIPGGLSLTVFSSTYLQSATTHSVLIGVEVQGLAREVGQPSGTLRRLNLTFTADADARPPIEHTVAVPLGELQTLTTAAREGVRVLARMALPPGPHAVRIAATDSGTGATVVLVHNVDVLNLVALPVTMSNLILSGTRVGGVTQTERDEDALLPLVGRPPTGRRQFRRGERVEVNTEIYDATTNTGADDDFESLSVSLTIQAADGRVVFEALEQGASEPLESGVYGYRYYGLVPIDSLEPGPYTVRVAALINGVAAASQSVPITVVGAN